VNAKEALQGVYDTIGRRLSRHVSGLGTAAKLKRSRSRGITRNRSRHRAAAFATRYAATELSDPTRCNPFPNRTMATAHIGQDRFIPSDKNLSADHGSNFRLDSRRYQFA
jgi:hypothetical protein